MLPLWIINLTEDTSGKEVLKELIGQLSGGRYAYWYYTEIEAPPVDGIESCSLFLDELREKGRACYEFFQQEGYVISNFQICIVGNAAEERTRSSFQLLPALLRELIPSIQGEYVHHGVEIAGLLLASYKLLYLPGEERSQCALFLEELNTLTYELGNNYYNRIVIYQEIQRPDQRYYSELDSRQLQELLFQYLLHLYYIEKDKTKILDKQPANGFYALGVASLYYDSGEHKEATLYKLLVKMITELKDPENLSVEQAEAFALEKFPRERIAGDEILKKLQAGCNGPGIDIRDLEGEPDPHPVWHFNRVKLYLSYYLDYLAYLPARASGFTRMYARLLSGKLLLKIQKNREEAFEKTKSILQQFGELFSCPYIRFTTFAQVKEALNVLKRRLEEEKKKIEARSLHEQKEIVDVPAYLKTYYDACKAEPEQYSEKELLNRMKATLQSEPTLLSLLSRCFLLGTVSIFVVIPLLREISPFLIDLGDVAKHEVLWIVFFFFLPFVLYGMRFRRRFLFVRKQKRIVLARALVSVQAKASVALYSEAKTFYDQMIQACDDTWKQYEIVMENITAHKTDRPRLDIPATLFHQPLIEGAFENRNVLMDEKAIELEVVFRNSLKKVSSLIKDDYLNLLKELFTDPDHSPLLIDSKQFKELTGEKLIQCRERNISRLLNDVIKKDARSLDITPLVSMAGINGIITATTDKKGMIIRCPEKIIALFDTSLPEWQEDTAYRTEPCLFVTIWCKAENKLNIKQFCNKEELDSFHPEKIPFSTLLTCLFAQYKQKNNRYGVAGKKVPVAMERLQALEKDIQTIINK
ncbi:MAG: hypothetical protein LBK45_05150 [Tannerellaceae bacterium]|jgi:hypothetical protein|nr:hypothetical protein [Tannerellaceae bacterium]